MSDDLRTGLISPYLYLNDITLIRLSLRSFRLYICKLGNEYTFDIWDQELQMQANDNGDYWNTVRECDNCSSITFHHIKTEDGSKFVCTTCGCSYMEFDDD
jgi:hypothetical protein